MPMNALRERFAEAGCTRVETYIQSGNVVFDFDPAAVATLDDQGQLLSAAGDTAALLET